MSILKTQVLARAEDHTRDVVPTQAKREAEVAMRKANRTNTAQITAKKVSKDKTNTP